ncbi:hypothetical protein SEPCBS57363_006305 [Sporothrix epigloea]|uniref:C2H2-type domain-containing protein n=1 Tax=Sporothrix epigloea TaxID=1892477 RepID=A0ABP0E2C5_9PEZI
MAASLLSYPRQTSLPHAPHYASYPGQQTRQQQQPQGPPSPPMDDTKCSLPSISNLLDLADQGSPASETSPQSQQMQQQSSQQQHPSQDFSFNSSSRPSTRPNSSHYPSNPMSLRGGVLPPTPPMTSEASFGSGYDSPSAKSLSQLPHSVAVVAANSYYPESTPPPQAPYSHESAAPEHRHNSHTTQHHQPQPQRNFPYSASSYSQHTYYPAMQQPTPPPQPLPSGLYYQRPLPHVGANTYPPMHHHAHHPHHPHHPHHAPSPWQHHHYISPSAAAGFPQSQDRYICATCNKAFSRPSSLRIHSHSHTGEKPFHCPHRSCGKAFSVRSNMKRHERGCHSFNSGK